MPLGSKLRSPPLDCRWARRAGPWRGHASSGLSPSTGGFSKKRLKPGKKERGCWERHASVPCGSACNSLHFHSSSLRNRSAVPTQLRSSHGLLWELLTCTYSPPSSSLYYGAQSVTLTMVLLGGWSPEDPRMVLLR